MTKEELATLLNGREIGNEITSTEAKQAEANRLVVVYGASDDLMEFVGAINGEIGAGDSTTAYIVDGKLWQGVECDHRGEGCKWAKAAAKDAKARGRAIDALWTSEGDYSWTYLTEIPHATFEIVEDGEPYCRGIVFSLSDL